jgi:hypothetical protein
METTVIDTSTLRRVGGQRGSNPAGVFEDEHGRRFYVKTVESRAHSRNELLAARLYQLAGAPTLTYVQTARPDQVATVWVELEKKRISQLSESERRQAQHWFGVHAWTANWDAAGFEGDNQGVLSGTVVTLDMGGALLFRAQGDLKGKAFGTRVDELSRLRSDPDNPHALKLFGDMSDDDLLGAISVVLKIPDDEIRRAIAGALGTQALAEQNDRP